MIFVLEIGSQLVVVVCMWPADVVVCIVRVHPDVIGVTIYVHPDAVRVSSGVDICSKSSSELVNKFCCLENSVEWTDMEVRTVESLRTACPSSDS